MKIDVTKIEGYESMSAEDKLKALEEFEIPDHDYTGWVKKEALDKAASDAAKYKKELREKMSAEEAAKVAAAEEMSNLKAEVEALKAEKIVSQNTAKFLAIGYDEKSAAEIAEAMANGDMETIVKSHTSFVEGLKKSIKDDLIKNGPKPPAGSGTQAVDYEAKIREAQAAGDYSAAAYYMRLAQTEASDTK